jgi:hypothetical protein
MTGVVVYCASECKLHGFPYLNFELSRSAELHCNLGDCIGGLQFRPRPKLKIQSWGQREESRKEVGEGSGSSLLRKLTGRACAGICRGPYS